MEITARILFIIFVIMVINSGVKYPLEKLTMYKKQDITYQSAWFVILFAFFGVFMLLFYKPIRQYRKEYFIKNKVRMYEFWVLEHHTYPPEETELPLQPERMDDLWDEYLNNKRYLKLKTIQRKTKRNVFSRNLHRILTK